GCGLQFRTPASSTAHRRSTSHAGAQMAATNPGDGSRAHRPYLESRRTTVVSRASSQGLEPVSRLRGTAPKTNSQYNLPAIGKKIAYKANRDGVAERFADSAVQKS